MEAAVAAREVRVFPDPAGLASSVASEFLRCAEDAFSRGGSFSIALSGGGTPRATYEEIASRGAELDWSRIHVFWADERCGALDSSDSNFRMAKEALLSRVPVPPGNVLPWETHRPPAEAADAYENRLGLFFGERLPAFDWIFLGVGEDGHTASLFPDTAALSETRRPVAANFVPKLDSWRLTLTLPALNAAKRCVILAQGREKAPVVRKILSGVSDLPAARVAAAETIWMLDRAAAP